MHPLVLLRIIHFNGPHPLSLFTFPYQLYMLFPLSFKPCLALPFLTKEMLRTPTNGTCAAAYLYISWCVLLFKVSVCLLVSIYFSLSLSLSPSLSLCLFFLSSLPLPPFLSSPSQSLCLCFSLRLSLSAHKSPEKTGIHFHGTVHILAQRLPPSLFMAFQTSDILCFYDKSICSGFLSSLNWPFLLLLFLLPRTSTFLLLTPFSSLQT